MIVMFMIGISVSIFTLSQTDLEVLEVVTWRTGGLMAASTTKSGIYQPVNDIYQLLLDIVQGQ